MCLPSIRNQDMLYTTYLKIIVFGKSPTIIHKTHNEEETNNVNIAFAKGGAHSPIKGQPTI